MSRILVAAAILLSLAGPAGAAVEAHAGIQPEVVGLEEAATFWIEIRGDGFSSLRFRPSFELENLDVVGGPSRDESMRFANGKLSRTFRISWQVRPQRPGPARVRSISIQLEDEVRQLPNCEIQVQRQAAGPARRAFGGVEDQEDDPFRQFFGRFPNPWRRTPQQPEVFLRAEVQPQQPVVGQQVLYTLYLYTREDIASLSPSGVPTFRGFWVQDIPIPQQLPTEMLEVDGRRYGRVPLLRKALFPLRSGRHAVEPAAVDLMVQHYDRTFFFGPPIARPEALRLVSDRHWVDVQPLPPSPPRFGGAVGQLALTADLQPRQVRLGEAATLTVRLTGVGNLQGIAEPTVASQPGFTVFSPQQEGRDELAGTTLRGSRTWRYVVVPERSGHYRLNTPEITFFDPSSRRYEVAAAPDLPLTALPRAAESLGAEGGAPHGIRAAASGATGLRSRPWTRLLPWLFALPWGLVLLVTLARRRANGASLRWARSPAPELEAGLRQAAVEERPRQAAARIEASWRDFLAERWNVPAATPPARWRGLLTARGVDPEVLDELDRVVEDLQYLRYAPQLSTTENLRSEVISRCRLLLRRLR